MTPHERDTLISYIMLALLVAAVVTAAVVIAVVVAESADSMADLPLGSD